MSALSDEQLKKEFRRIDKDNDGSITVEELEKYYLPMQEMRGLLKRLDVDNSGVNSFEGSIIRSVAGDLFLSLFSEFKLFCSKP